MTKPLDGLFDDGLVVEAAAAPPKPGIGGFLLGRAAPAVAAMTGINRLIGGNTTSPAQMEADAIGELVDPGHEAQLQRIRMQAMLAEFLSTDPVISTYDPDQVVDAYNQIVQLTPRASVQPVVMRGQLRKMLQQQDALEPFEAEQILKVEKGIKDVQEPQKLPIAPIPDVPTFDEKKE